MEEKEKRDSSEDKGNVVLLKFLTLRTLLKSRALFLKNEKHKIFWKEAKSSSVTFVKLAK